MADKDSRPSRGGPAWNRSGRVVVWLRFLIVPAWIAATVIAVTHLPSAFEAEAGELGNLLPRSSSALEVERKALDTFGLPLLSRTMVVAREPRGFSPTQASAAARYIAAADRSEGPDAVKAVPLADTPGMLGAGGTATTIVAYLYLNPDLSEDESQESAERFAAGLGRATSARVKVTGALPGARAETEIAESHLIWVELATALLVVAILALYFRSFGVPLLGLATVAIAYLCADRLLGWIAERYGLSIPREAEPVIVALIFGVLTDYLVFFVSGYRQRLRQGDRTTAAVSETAAELLPVILTAALMIAGATLTLLLSGVRFLSAFGPSMAAAVIVSALVAMTLVPAALAIFGRALLWPRGLGQRSSEGGDERGEKGASEGSGARGLLLGLAVRLPVLTVILCVAILLAAASGLRHLELGNPVMRGLPETSEPRQGYDAAAAGIGPGVLGPTMLVLEGSGIAEREAALASLQVSLEEDPQIVGVLGPDDQPLPLRSGVMLAPDGNAARYVLALDGDPDGAAATEALSQLEAELPAMLERSGLRGAQTGITGDTTIASELSEDTTTAFERVAPAALVVLLILLWFLLRSWAAPLYLVGSSLLVVAAALGLTVYVFQDLLGYGELAFFVPIASAILLLALGADYNVFLISRIWREAEDQELRLAIRIAGIRAGRAITVAGFILALSFAAVALIPIQGFREIAFALCAGLLLDTLVARTLLVPALVAIFGRGTQRATSERLEPSAHAAAANRARHRRESRR